MTDATTEFFHGLETRHEPRLEKVTATLRFELMNGKQRRARWLVAIDRGDIAVSHKNAKADCVVHADSALFEGIAKGEVNAFAAALRGRMGIEGNPEVLVMFQRLFPAPPRSKS